MMKGLFKQQGASLDINIITSKEARAFIEAQRANTNSYEITKYSNEAKAAKQKGEVVDEWYRVTLYKNIDSEKEPVSAINVIKYEEE